MRTSGIKTTVSSTDRDDERSWAHECRRFTEPTDEFGEDDVDAPREDS